MSTDAATPSSHLTHFEQLRFGREVIQVEAEALASLAKRLDRMFCDAVELLFACSGCVIVTGMGKAGLIGQKIAATLASTGTNSHFLHPAEALHGDLGRVQKNDVVLALSASGETDEMVRMLPSLRAWEIPLVSITGHPNSTLAQHSRIVLTLGPLREACSLGLAPSTSTTAMLAMGDALALVLSRKRQFRQEDFARVHPGGTLGRKLAKVEELMRPLSVCRVAAQSQTVRGVLVSVSKPGRRTGAIMLIDDTGSLTGIFTDSDLARLLEREQEASLELAIGDVMTSSPKTIAVGARLEEAVAVLAQCKISELPVVDARNRPLGMVDITDLVGLVPSTGQFTCASTARYDSSASTVPFQAPTQRDRA